MRKLIAMDIRLIDDRRVMADAVDAAEDKNVGREEEGPGEWANLN